VVPSDSTDIDVKFAVSERARAQSLKRFVNGRRAGYAMKWSKKLEGDQVG